MQNKVKFDFIRGTKIPSPLRGLGMTLPQSSFCNLRRASELRTHKDIKQSRQREEILPHGAGANRKRRELMPCP